MLFLDTLEVKANSVSPTTSTFTSSFYIYPNSVGYDVSFNIQGGTVSGTVDNENSYFYNPAYTGSMYGSQQYISLSPGFNENTVYNEDSTFTGSINLSGSSTSSVTSTYELDYAFPILIDFGEVSNFSQRDYFALNINSLTQTCSFGSCVPMGCFIDGKDALGRYTFLRYWDLARYKSGATHLIARVLVKGHWSYVSNSTDAVSPTLTFTFNCQLVDSDLSSYSQSITQTHDEALTQSSQAIEESVTSETGTGLLATIKNFFGSFFSNIINSFISLFVPSSDYFSTWFENLNDLLSEKLGMLYAPFDFIISILNSVYSADTSEPSIPFPAITWDGTTLVSAQNLKFSELLGDNYSTLQGYVYFGTDTVLLFAFLYLLQRKIALILTGSEANG